MNDQTLATSSTLEEERTLGRRELLKALTAGGGAIAASAMLSGKWVKPVVEVGVLPAHAQSSVLTYFSIFFSVTPASEVEINSGRGPSAVKVTVQGNKAYVEANNGNGSYRTQAILDTGGTPTYGDDMTIFDNCGDPSYVYSDIGWSVLNYDDNQITIYNSGSVSEDSDGWTVIVPRGDGTLPDLNECNNEG